MAPLQLPDTAEGWVEFLSVHCDGQLTRARTTVEEIAAHPDDPADATLSRWNTVTLALLNATSAAVFFSQAHPDEELRARAEQAQQAAASLGDEIRQDRRLYEIFGSISPEQLDEDAARVLKLTIRDFRRAGVELAEPERQRLHELVDRCTVLGQEFERNITDDLRSISLSPEQLAGLPDDYVAAHPVGPDGRVVVTTNFPDAVPFVKFAHDAAARREVSTQFESQGWPANDPVLHELLEVRRERARMLGYDGWADYDAEIKMIGSGAAIREHIDHVADMAAPVVRRELEALNRRARQDGPDAAEEQLCWSDIAYYIEVLRRERFGVDGREVSRYLDCSKVVRGLLDVTGRMFGLEFVEVPDVPTWHPDVDTYDVLEAGTLIGRFHLDLYSRPGKYALGQHFALKRGVEGLQLPQSALFVDVPRGLLDHDEVVMLFHEFGHLLNSILGGQQGWARDSGVATERDFVEAPAQMFEEWTRDPGVLRGFATDRDGHPIPMEFVEHLRDAEVFGRGCFIATQVAFSEMSYALHEEVPDDLTTCVMTAAAKYAPVPALPDTHPHAAFGHLADDRYSSGYYAYVWSLLVAVDLLTGFDPADLTAAEPARRFRDLVLSPGGSRDGAELIEAFLNRPGSDEAFARWLSRAAEQTVT